MLDSINIRSTVPVYMQIENEVMFAIASGRLRPGDRLPTVPELSGRLKININTVANAYRDLAVMGYVTSRRGVGVAVAKGVAAGCYRKCVENVVARLHEVASEAKAAGMSASEIKAVVRKCLAVDSSPYGKTPAEVLALAKGRRGKR